MSLILERAVKRIVAKLEARSIKDGHLTPEDAWWILGYLEEALNLYESLEKPLKPLDLNHDLPTTTQESTSASCNDGYQHNLS